MWKAWLINLKKTKISLLWLVGLVAVFLTTTGFIQDNIEDNLHLLNKETKTLITEKNNRYFQTKEQPQITVITVKRLNKLTPKALDHSKRSVFIVVGQKGKKRNVQIFFLLKICMVPLRLIPEPIFCVLKLINCAAIIKILLMKACVLSFALVLPGLTSNINMHWTNMI